MRDTILACSHCFDNGVVVVNTTPHTITFDVEGEPVSVPSSVPAGMKTGPLVINARVQEMPYGKHTVRSVFIPDNAAKEIIDAIQVLFYEEAMSHDLMIVGSLIAANTYHEVVGMCPAPGYERVPIAEKRMSCSKFNQGEA